MWEADSINKRMNGGEQHPLSAFFGPTCFFTLILYRMRINTFIGAATACNCVTVLAFLLTLGAGSDAMPTLRDAYIGIPITLQLQSTPFIEVSPGVKPGALVACERVQIPGLPRLKNIKKYAHSLRVKVELSKALLERYSQKIEVCFHGNASIGLGQCSKDEWKPVQKGLWSATMSPYETKFVDIRAIDTFSVSVTISVEEEFLPWRLFFLGAGLVMLLVAPIVSEWVPFYYSSAMMLGIILVILMLLFQGMKLLPTGRKSAIYLAFYGSIVGLGSFIVHYFSGLVNSILQKIGLGDEMYNPVAVFLLLGVVLTGAWLGYWGVRKFVLTEDGSVEIGTAHFVKWAIRIVAIATILQSSHDPLFAVLAVVAGLLSISTLRLMLRRVLHLRTKDSSLRMNQQFLRHRVENAYVNHVQTEFLNKAPIVDADQSYSCATMLQQSPYGRHSPLKHGVLSAPHESTSSLASIDGRDYYSTFHKTPQRNRFSKEEWEIFTRESTRKAMNELVSNPEFSEWVIAHADRIMVFPPKDREDSSSDETESADDTEQEDDIEGGGWFGW